MGMPENSPLGPALFLDGVEDGVLFFPSMQGIARTSGKSKWKGSAGRDENLPNFL